MYGISIGKLQSILPPTTNIPEAYRHGFNEEQVVLIQNLALFFTLFYEGMLTEMAYLQVTKILLFVYMFYHAYLHFDQCEVGEKRTLAARIERFSRPKLQSSRAFEEEGV
ncbi:unnamed protein product [Vicia faba]|uniref:Uncharacterized protein n=1 Tax=Vicia faba TaxID=3906 RepID=A0AAV0YX05_VICFA|nr:unnamed protein product [Vicia faba]